MATRSLVGKLSGRTVRMPPSGAVAPKDNPGMKRCASSRMDTSNHDSTKQRAEGSDPMKGRAEFVIEEMLRLREAEHLRYMRAYNRNTALITMVGLGAAYYLSTRTSNKESSNKSTGTGI